MGDPSPPSTPAHLKPPHFCTSFHVSPMLFHPCWVLPRTLLNLTRRVRVGHTDLLQGGPGHPPSRWLEDAESGPGF